jgi:hypothetical protein
MQTALSALKERVAERRGELPQAQIDLAEAETSFNTENATALSLINQIEDFDMVQFTPQIEALELEAARLQILADAGAGARGKIIAAIAVLESQSS